MKIVKTLLITAAIALGIAVSLTVGIGAPSAGNPGKYEIKEIEQGIAEGIEEYEFVFATNARAGMVAEGIKSYFMNRGYCIFTQLHGASMGTVVNVTVVSQARVMEYLHPAR